MVLNYHQGYETAAEHGLCNRFDGMGINGQQNSPLLVSTAIAVLQSAWWLLQDQLLESHPRQAGGTGSMHTVQ